ncbi:hypothetical protein, partial [Lacticaseibacillus rhamnosus]|uniref:hypothetical protein n=1 Tax=Lacticaseibacillus rhamnosus TaxID=47715 RepID=UPI001CDD73DD
ALGKKLFVVQKPLPFTNFNFLFMIFFVKIIMCGNGAVFKRANTGLGWWGRGLGLWVLGPFVLVWGRVPAFRKAEREQSRLEKGV